ncbi:MAG: two-component sensor histidine kinase [Gemmatimonadales bacterium]|nr:MAG: two-component sensor histidine kinase [Gemmatimonadales bacterium]
MIGPRSFRGRLALRFGTAVSALTLVGSVVGYLALRTILYQRLDGILLRLAAIEAAATADSPDESVHFHDEVFLSAGPGHETILSRYAEVWTLDGEPVVRTRNLEGRDLPLPVEVRERVVHSRSPELFQFEWEGERYRAVLYPLGLIGPQHRLHLLEVAASTRETDALLSRVATVLLVLVGVGFVLGGGLGWWLAGYAVRPVLQIIEQAETLDPRATGHQIAVQTETEELKRLIGVLNAALARIDAAFESQRRFIADAGHAIKTPITILRGDVEVALRRPRAPEEYVQVLRQALEDLKQVSALAENLITLARSDSGALHAARQPVEVDYLFDRVRRKFEGAAARAGSGLECEPASGLVVTGDPQLLERALSNVVDNAIKYAGSAGPVRLSAAVLTDGWVALRVTDRGPGIPAAERDRVFDRFYRGERSAGQERGFGLGLAIVKAIMENLGGRVTLDTGPEGGLTVSLVCPAADRAP